MKDLVVEVDLEYLPKEVSLRLFETSEDGSRILLPLQEIYKIVQQDLGGNGNGLNADDQKLLRQLWPLLNKSNLRDSNLEEIKLPKNQFDRLLSKWTNSPARFIEKISQNFYMKTVPKASVRFKLNCRGATSELAAKVKVSSGVSCPYHMSKRLNSTSITEVIIDEQRFELDCPVKFEVMEQVFGEKNPEIPTDKIEKYLPIVLEGRLDLLDGRSVRHKKIKVKPKLELKADGADVLITLFLGRFPVNIRMHETAAPTKLVQKGRIFEVRRYKCSYLKEILASLGELPLSKSFRNYWKLQGTAENIKKLYDIYLKLKLILRIKIDPDLQSLFKSVSPVQSTMIFREGHGWLDVHVVCQTIDIKISDMEIQQAIRHHHEFVRTRDGKWVRLDPNSLANLITQMDDMGLEFGLQRISNLHASRIVKGIGKYPDLYLPPDSAELLSKIQDRHTIKPPQYTVLLKQHLRKYQKEGADFLFNRTSFDLGCILADDMGLGKTLQLLAYLIALKRKKKSNLNALIICPASVLHVWLKESSTFTPEIDISLFNGSIEKRRSLIDLPETWDVIVATYAVIRNDILYLKNFKFDVVALDEAQQIKNPDADVTKAIKSLDCDHRIAISGTPLENRLLDLWSIVDFLNPEFLGDRDEFRENYVNSEAGLLKLPNRIAPFLIRRLKSQVASELPPRTEEAMVIPLTKLQTKLYKEELEAAREDLRNKGTVEILAALTKLRQICCHPQLLYKNLGKTSSAIIKDNSDRDQLESAKLGYLIEKLFELRYEGHSALVFSQFTSMLDIIENQLKKNGFDFFKITGETPVNQRAQITQDFQNSNNPSMFLLSLKAAGTGLTLTKAEYVFIYDPWWNPAVESQAIDRTHRIGQENPVIAYRLVAAETIEEKIMKMKEEKRQLFTEFIEGAASLPSQLNVDDLIELLEDE